MKYMKSGKNGLKNPSPDWVWHHPANNPNAIQLILNYINAIKDIFGEEYVKILEDYEYFDANRGDFVVKGKTISELNDLEIAKLEIIAERRFYAFEWLCTDDAWDNVDLSC